MDCRSKHCGGAYHPVCPALLKVMNRIFDFSCCKVAVEGLPDYVADGDDLLPFCSSGEPDVTLHVTTQPVPLPGDVRKLGADRRVVWNGKTYLASIFTNSIQTIWFAPQDWNSDKITAFTAPCVLNDAKFTTNQLLAVTGFTSALLYRGCLTLHSSYILYQNRAILFAAPSGTGKSTQAALWERHRGAEVINGDRALLFQKDGRWFAGGISFCGTSNICRNQTAPLSAVVLLEQWRDNQILPCSAGERFRALLAGSVYHRWSTAELEKVSELCQRAAESAPVLRLRCRPDEDAVRTLEEALEKQL